VAEVYAAKRRFVEVDRARERGVIGKISVSHSRCILAPMARAKNGRREQKTFEHRKLRRASKRVMQGTRVGTGKQTSGQPLARDLRRLTLGD
jgi:hypothetical protein